MKKNKAVSPELTSHVIELTQPLLLLGIDSFGYHKIYGDGSEAMLSNDPKWSEHVYKNHLMLAEYKEYIDQSGFQKVIWPDSDIPILTAVREVSQWNTGISIRNNKGEYFGFSIRKQNKDQVLNTLLQNIESLEKFCIYFSEQATSLQKSVLRMQNNNQAPTDLNSALNIKNNLSADAVKIFHNSLFIDKINHGKNKYQIKITHRQLSVLRLLFKGYTAKEIANELYLSFRTIEAHIYTLKSKFNCTTKRELIRYLTQLSYDKYFLD